jgi:hypothetical protein
MPVTALMSSGSGPVQRRLGGVVGVHATPVVLRVARELATRGLGVEEGDVFARRESSSATT